MMATVPTPITDKNGHSKIVHKNPDKDAASFNARILDIINARPVTPLPADVKILAAANDTSDSETNAIEFLEVSDEIFHEHFTPEKILENAHRIYDYMLEHDGVDDSVAREGLFTYAAEKLNIDYDVLYNKWMKGEPDEVSSAPVATELVVENDIPESRTNAIEFLEVSEEVFDKEFTPDKILENAPRIYEHMRDHGGMVDSVAREGLFTYASESLGLDYEVIYNKWLNG